MGLFWRRKSGDEFVRLGLNEPAKKEEKPREVDSGPQQSAINIPEIVPAVTGAGPTPLPVEPKEPEVRKDSQPETLKPAVKERPVPSRSPFATSVLGLNLSMEELQAQEAALEQELSSRFRRAVSSTRESLSEKLDTVFAGRKQIDDELLDQLEEVLIAADIGVPTTLEVLETVRRGIARKQINDIEALKNAIKNELLSILRASERQGVASETTVPESGPVRHDDRLC